MSVSRFVKRLEAFRQFRSLNVRHGGLINKDTLAPRPLQGGKLQVGVLVFGRDLRIAYCHGQILSLISGTAKPLINQWKKCVPKILITDTASRTVRRPYSRRGNERRKW